MTNPTLRRSACACAAITLATLALLSGCRREVNTFAPPPPPEVTVTHPVRRPVTRFLEYTGTTEPFLTVDLRARVAGFLEQVNFQPGAEVRKGELLFVIDRRPYQAAVDRAKAQVLADEAAYTAAESDARIAEELASQRAGSEIDKIIKVGRRDTAKAAVAAAKAALASAALELEFCDVHSPIDGRITKNFVDVGNLVGAAGQPTLLATVVCSHPLYVTVDVSEQDVMLVRRLRLAHAPHSEPGEVEPGVRRRVDLATADSDEFTVAGHIDFVDPAIDARTGTLRVRCRFENEDDSLLPGTFVRLRAYLDTEDALLVPDTALLSDQNGRYALVINSENVVEMRRVRIGALDGAMRVITEGLSLDDRVVVKGLQRARPGAVVKPALQQTEAASAGGSGV